MKKFCFLSMGLAFLSLVSCQQEDVTTNRMYSDDFMAKLKFNTINLSMTRASGRDGHVLTKDDKDPVKNEDVNIGIFSVRIARASKDCASGFGLCDFKWFPGNPNSEVIQLIDSDSLYKNSFRIQRDTEGNKFVDLELLERPKGLDVCKLQPVVVEDQLESFSTINGKEEKMTVQKGVYSFDSSIGKFGGYRVPLK